MMKIRFHRARQIEQRQAPARRFYSRSMNPGFRFLAPSPFAEGLNCDFFQMMAQGLYRRQFYLEIGLIGSRFYTLGKSFATEPEKRLVCDMFEIVRFCWDYTDLVSSTISGVGRRFETYLPR